MGLDIEQAFDGFCVYISLLTAEQNKGPRRQLMILTQPAEVMSQCCSSIALGVNEFEAS